MAQHTHNKHNTNSADESRPLLRPSGDNQPSSSQDRESYTSPSSSPRLDDRSSNDSNVPFKGHAVQGIVDTSGRTQTTRPGSASPATTGSGSSTDTDSEESEEEENSNKFTSSLHSSSVHNNNNNTSASSSTTTSPSDQEQAVPQRRRHHHHHRHRRPRTPYQIMLSAFAQSGLFIFFGTLAAVVIKAPWVSPFSWHPICMGIYGFVSTQAVLLLQPNLTGQRKEGGKTLHFFLLTVALISSIFGFRAIWNNKELVNKPHFHTNHAYLGGITLMIFLCQVLYGIIVGYAPATIYGRVGKARATRIHRVFGYTSITLLWATLWWGVLSSWMEKNFNGYQWIFALSMGMVAVGVVGQITPQRLWLKSRPSKRGEREVSPSDANAAVPSEQ